MLIECPSCRSRAELPDSKAGARVRCGECGRVYVAATRGGRRTRVTGPNMGLLGGLAAGILVLMVVLFIVNQSGDEAEAARVVTSEPREKTGQEADGLGWNAPAVQAAAAVHAAVQAHDDGRLESLLHGPRLWAADESVTRGGEVDPEGWRILPLAQRREHVALWIARFKQGEESELLSGWSAFDGRVLRVNGDHATVRLSLSPAEGGAAQRYVDWQLAKDKDRWKVYAYERWLSPGEIRKEEVRVEREIEEGAVEKVTLSDGTEVFEREPEPLEHLETTPPDLRKRIDGLYAKLINLDLTTEASAAKRELVTIGKPAIPILLTGLYEIPIDNERDAIKVNILNQTLANITGNTFGYKPQRGEAASLSEEKRQSAIKQWFAWWYRNREAFVKKQVEDLLEDHIQLTESDRKWLERHKD